MADIIILHEEIFSSFRVQKSEGGAVAPPPPPPARPPSPTPVPLPKILFMYATKHSKCIWNSVPSPERAHVCLPTRKQSNHQKKHNMYNVAAILLFGQPGPQCSQQVIVFVYRIPKHGTGEMFLSSCTIRGM